MYYPFKATIGWSGKPEKAFFDLFAVYEQDPNNGQWVVTDFYIQLMNVTPI